MMTRIGSEGVIEIVKALRENNTLKVLNLLGTGIEGDQETIHYIAEFLKNNKCLIKLDLSLNVMWNAEISTVIESLKINSTLKELKIRGGKYNGSKEVFIDALMQNTSLTVLEIDISNKDYSDKIMFMLKRNELHFVGLVKTIFSRYGLYDQPDKLLPLTLQELICNYILVHKAENLQLQQGVENLPESLKEILEILEVTVKEIIEKILWEGVLPPRDKPLPPNLPHHSNREVKEDDDSDTLPNWSMCQADDFMRNEGSEISIIKENIQHTFWGNSDSESQQEEVKVVIEEINERNENDPLILPGNDAESNCKGCCTLL